MPPMLRITPLLAQSLSVRGCAVPSFVFLPLLDCMFAVRFLGFAVDGHNGVEGPLYGTSGVTIPFFFKVSSFQATRCPDEANEGKRPFIRALSPLCQHMADLSGQTDGASRS